MKDISFIIFNDAHLKTGNEREVIKSTRHMVNYAVEKKVKDIVFAGDLFDSRTFQRQEVLKTFDTMLSMFSENGITLYLFPGNHDKTEYSIKYSFLEIYRYHPCVKFYNDTSLVLINGVSVTLLPFFSDEILIPKIEEAEGSDILISHFEMQGSTNLGNISEKASINRKMLKKWSKVYLGHYHNHHEINSDIVHLPSLRQSNFGEDSNKGFTIIYDDLSYDIIKGEFKEFHKLVIDINETSIAEVKRLIEIHKNSENTIRFEFIGDESKLKAIDKSQFKDSGIDVKLKYEAKYSFDEGEVKMPTVTEYYGEKQVRQNFKEFCEDKGYDHSKGNYLLDEFFNKEDGKEK